jgi:hypothetical protein
LKLPFCNAHQNKVRNWARLPYLNAGIWLVLTVLFIFVFPFIAKNGPVPPWFEQVAFTFFCIGWPVVSAAWLLAQCWITWSAPITYHESGPHHFVLRGVAEPFANAVKNERDGNWLLWQVEAAGRKEESPPEEGFTETPPQPPDPSIQPGPR